VPSFGANRHFDRRAMLVSGNVVCPVKFDIWRAFEGSASSPLVSGNSISVAWVIAGQFGATFFPAFNTNSPAAPARYCLNRRIR
jgi:hypothetical protein